MEAPPWNKREKDKLRININTMSYSKLAELIPGRTIDAVKQRASLLGLPRLGRRFPKRSLHEHFFSKPNLLSCYWAGFIAADGCVVTTPRRELRLGINKRDELHLARFKMDVGYDGPIRKCQKNIKALTICAIDQWVLDLRENFSITPKKTKTLLPPSLVGDLALSFSVGVIDGDGCWNISKNGLALIVTGTESVLLWLKDRWELGGANTGQCSPRPIKGCWRLSVNGRYAVNVAHLLLPLKVPRLERKWSIAKKGGAK